MKSGLQCVNTTRDANLPGQAPGLRGSGCPLQGQGLCNPVEMAGGLGARGVRQDSLLAPLPCISLSVLPSHPQIHSSHSCQAREGLPVHTEIPGPRLCPRPRCTGLIRNTCVHGISCPGSAFISSASKNPRHAKVKETSQSITRRRPPGLRRQDFQN